ncbi:hypothetical protein [Streptomyces sp. NPDC001422]|uniref:hypothetical protein n=1 Tax=Streptomyces sp. NPDC001422 TaxID=3364575 RepID=UPI00369E8978
MSTTVKVAGAAGAVLLGLSVYGVNPCAPGDSGHGDQTVAIGPEITGNSTGTASKASHETKKPEAPVKKETEAIPRQETSNQVPAGYKKPETPLHTHKKHHQKPHKADTRPPKKGPGKHRKPKLSLNIKVKVDLKQGVKIQATLGGDNLIEARAIGGINPLQ